MSGVQLVVERGRCAGTLEVGLHRLISRIEVLLIVSNMSARQAWVAISIRLILWKAMVEGADRRRGIIGRPRVQVHIGMDASKTRSSTN